MLRMTMILCNACKCFYCQLARNCDCYKGRPAGVSVADPAVALPQEAGPHRPQQGQGQADDRGGGRTGRVPFLLLLLLLLDPSRKISGRQSIEILGP